MFIVPRTEPQPASTRPQVTWEESPCPQCAGRHWTPLIEAQDHRDGDAGLWFAIVQCDSCGTCYTNPRPDAASIESFHGDNSSSQQKHHQPRTISRWNVFRWLNRPRVEKPSIAWHGQGRLLDVACEAGDYLRMMHRRGWTVAGIDSSTQHAELIQTALGLTVFLGMLPHSELEH